MREIAERKVWRQLQAKGESRPSKFVSFEDASLDLADPCIVLGGRNGVGKSRILKAMAEELGAKARYIDLHYVTQRILQAARHRTDIAEMLDEYDPLDFDAERREDVVKVVGRDYDEIKWYALELDTKSEEDAETPPEMEWLSSEPMPYFTARFRGQEYMSLDMGLGEFGVHLLFWYLHQWAETEEITYLLLVVLG